MPIILGDSPGPNSSSLTSLPQVKTSQRVRANIRPTTSIVELEAKTRPAPPRTGLVGEGDPFVADAVPFAPVPAGPLNQLVSNPSQCKSSGGELLQ